MDYDTLILKIKLMILFEAVQSRLSTIAEKTEMSQRTLEKWRKISDESKPSPRYTKKVCAVLGIEHDILQKNKELYTYLKYISRTYEKKIENMIFFLKDATDDFKNIECKNGKTINDIVNSLENKFEKENNIINIEKDITHITFQYLQNTIKTVTLPVLRNEFEMLQGKYNTFKYFDPMDGNEGKLSITCAEIYDIDTKNMVLKCRFPSVFGEYEGCVITARNKLFFLIESLAPKDKSTGGSFYYPEVLSIIIDYTENLPVDENNFLLYGIFNALSGNGRPCSSRIIWKKINDESKLIKTGYYFKDQIKGINNFDRIEKWIRNNRVDWKRGLVSIKKDSEELLSQYLINDSVREKLSYEKSFQLWKMLDDKVFFSEYKVNFSRIIEVLGVKDGYQNIRISTDYELRHPEREDLLFACSLEGISTDVIYDKECEVSWTFVPTDKNIKHLPDESFLVDSVYIGKDKFSPEPIQTSNKKVVFRVNANLKSNHKYKISYTFTVKQVAKYCFVSDNITKLTYNYELILDIKDQSIRDVYVKEFLLCETQRNQDQKFSNLKQYKVCGDGWTFPRGGVSFSWSMDNSILS